MKQRILIVDDSLTVRMRLSGLLETHGYGPLAVADLKSAREALAREPFSLLILDVDLPDGDGIEFLRELRGNPRVGNLPVMLLSTTAEVEDRVRGLQHGADEYLGKPFDDSFVVRRAKELISRSVASTFAIRLLIVEDSATYAAFLTDVLRREGYETLVAETGEEGLKLAAEQRPNAILVDSRLPGIDGPEVIRQIRQDAVLRRTPTLLLTASSDPEDEIRALHAGADSFVRKEQDKNVILSCINVLLRSASPVALEPPEELAANEVVCITHGHFFAQKLVDAVELRVKVSHYRSIDEFLNQFAGPGPDCVVVEVAEELEQAETDIKQLRAHSKLTDVSIIVLGTAAYADGLLRCVNAGADDYVAVAAGDEVLVARVAAQLRRKQYEDENRFVREQILRSQLIARSQQELALATASKNTELRLLAEMAQRKANEADEARNEFQQLAEAIPQIVWTATPDGDVTYFNRRWYDYTGFSQEASLGFSWIEAIEEASRTAQKQMWVSAVAQKRTYSSELRLRRHDGVLRWFLVRALPMRSAGGTSVRWFGTFTDIDDQKRTEEALRRTEKLAATGRLAATIAHEINNPLEALVNLIFLARTLATNDPGKSTEYLEMADKELARVAAISRQTLTFYRDTSTPRPTDLCALVREVAELYSAKIIAARLRVTSEYDCSLRPITLSGEIRQVVSNLLVNAIEASQPGGKVRIRVRDSFHHHTGVVGAKIVIADNGCGIKDNVRRSLFQPFNTTKTGRGTGLGLWLSSSIVERHGGELRVRSVADGPRSGTCMSVFLPGSNEFVRHEDEATELLKAVGRDLLKATGS